MLDFLFRFGFHGKIFLLSNLKSFSSELDLTAEAEEEEKEEEDKVVCLM